MRAMRRRGAGAMGVGLVVAVALVLARPGRRARRRRRPVPPAGLGGDARPRARADGLLERVGRRRAHQRWIDTDGKPATRIDFTVPVDGLAAPWRMAQIVYVYDGARVARPPRSIPAMLEWALANPGRLTHPTPRNFLGATFLKPALYELAPDPAVLQPPARAEPRALLLAEPFNRLDADPRDRFRRFVFTPARSLPTLLVTHDEADALAASGPILRLSSAPS